MPDRARFERDLRVIKETLATDPLVCRAALRWYEAERQRWNDCFILVHVLADQVPDGVL